MEKLEELNVALKGVYDEFPTINAGGCGFAALAIGRELKKRGVNFKYILVSDKNNLGSTRKAMGRFKTFTPEEISTPRKAVMLGYSIGHIMVYYKGLVIDAKGIRSWENCQWNCGWRIISCTLDEDLLKRWVYISRGWNQRFDRSDLPDIRRKVKEIFNQVYNQ